MTRLPPALRPLWPAVKVAHRAATRNLGRVTRATGYGGDRAVPRRATATAAQTATLEPESVRRHGVGEVEHLCRALPHGDPSGHWFFEGFAHYDVPQRFTLDLADGEVVGSYCANITAGGTLDMETSSYFGIKGWREHPIYLRPRLPTPETFDGTLVSLATRGSGTNYYHFLMDALPRWGILQESMPGTRPDAVLLNTGTSYQRELIAMLGLDRFPIREVTAGTAVRARHLLVPSLPNSDTVAPRWTTAWLRKNLPPKVTYDKPKLLYVTRGNRPNTRRMLQEEAVFAALEHRGFARLDPGTVPVQEQIDHFAAAEVIVAPHGAGLTNLNFCQPGVRLLELFAPRYLNPGYWSVLDNIVDSRYRYLVGHGRPTAVGSRMSGIQHDIDLSPNEVLDGLDQLLG